MSSLLSILLVLGVFLGFYHILTTYKDDVKKVIDRLPNPMRFRSSGGHAHSGFVKLVVFVPDSHAEQVRTAIGEAGGGRVGKYSYTSFSIAGIGRYKPGVGARPTIGRIGVLESVEEERIEVTVDRAHLDAVIAAINRIHPYEEKVIDIYSIETPNISETHDSPSYHGHH